MDAIEPFKQDVRDGRIDVDRLIDLIVTLQRQLVAAKQRIEELEKRLGGPPTSPTAKVDEAYSMRAEEKRQQDRHRVHCPNGITQLRRNRLPVNDVAAWAA